MVPIINIWIPEKRLLTSTILFILRCDEGRIFCRTLRSVSVVITAMCAILLFLQNSSHLDKRKEGEIEKVPCIIIYKNNVRRYIRSADLSFKLNFSNKEIQELVNQLNNEKN